MNILDKRVLIIGGTFDDQGGRSSYLVKQLAIYLTNLNPITINGGHINELYAFRPHNTHILIWMPNVDNSEDKILPRLKVMNPRMLLVSSKRVIENKYSDFDLTTRAINTKSNLLLKITRINKEYLFSILDPLGNQYASNSLIQYAAPRLELRILELLKMVRYRSKQMEFDIFQKYTPINPNFIDTVVKYGIKFDKYIAAINPKRFLGNASTRCTWGFPSQKSGDAIFVSKRNVNKSDITQNNFVRVQLMNDTVFYEGKDKPSVDTPVQLKLYKLFPNIRYMIHGHCYIKDAPMTENKLQCGDVREVDEIIKLVDNFKDDYYAFNLKGHGCIIMSKYVHGLSIPELEKRPFLEN